MLNWTGKLKTYLGEITSLASLLIGFGMILVGQAPGPWPQTMAVLVILFSTGILWGQWWPRIQRRSIILVVSSASSSADHWWDSLFDLVRWPAKHAYALPVGQRRLQCMILSGLTLTALTLAVPRFGGVIYEINPPELPVKMDCKGDESVDSLRIVVTEFNEQGGSSLLEDRISDQLLEPSKWGSGVLICRSQEVVKNRIEAQKFGKKAQAAIVIWGRSDQALSEVHLEIAQWELPDKQLRAYPTPEASAPSFQMREPVLVSFIVQFTLSQLLYVRGETLTARERLENAVQIAQNEGLTDNPEYANNFRDAYFLLGYFYDTDVSAKPNLDQAIDYYKHAIGVDGTFYPAYINLAIIYDSIGQIDLAIAEYTIVAEKAQSTNPNSAATAYINLAWLYVDSDRDQAKAYFAEAQKLSPFDAIVQHGIASLYNWKNPEQAIKDFSIAITLNPDDPYIYNHLGKAQLLNEQSTAALKTYRQAIQSARWKAGDVQEVIGQLELLASQEPKLKPVIVQIIQMLKAARLP